MIKAIFFDAAGILYTRGGPTEVYAINLIKQSGFNEEPSAEAHSQLLAIRAEANSGKVDHLTYWEAYLKSWHVMDSGTRSAMIGDIVRFSNDVQPVSGAKQALLALKSRNMLLGIITDTMYPVDWKMMRLKKAGVADLIDIVSCSTSLGAHKPDPEVYQYAIAQTPYSPGECAFVGHAGIELEGARATGMVTIAVNYDENSIADYYCESLGDLASLPIFD